MPITKITDTGTMDGKLIAYMYTAPGVIGVVPETRKDLLPQPKVEVKKNDHLLRGVGYFIFGISRIFCTGCRVESRFSSEIRDGDTVICKNCKKQLLVEMDEG